MTLLRAWLAIRLLDAASDRHAGTIANRQNPELHEVACEALRCDMTGLQEALLQQLHVRILTVTHLCVSLSPTSDRAAPKPCYQRMLAP